jgi:hypothetical protein
VKETKDREAKEAAKEAKEAKEKEAKERKKKEKHEKKMESEAKRMTLRSKFVFNSKDHTNKNTTVFGVPFEEVIHRENSNDVPEFVKHTFAFLIKTGSYTVIGRFGYGDGKLQWRLYCRSMVLL